MCDDFGTEFLSISEISGRDAWSGGLGEGLFGEKASENEFSG
jgi:hypothetical protein